MAQTLMEAVELSLRVWRYLALMGKDKDDLPDELLSEIDTMLWRCPLCEYFKPEDGCNREACPLYKNDVSCFDGDHPFSMWKNLYGELLSKANVERKKKFAKKIVEMLENWKQEHSTNHERIRNMDIQTLANYLCAVKQCKGCNLHDRCKNDADTVCSEQIKIWLDEAVGGQNDKP